MAVSFRQMNLPFIPWHSFRQHIPFSDWKTFKLEDDAVEEELWEK